MAGTGAGDGDKTLADASRTHDQATLLVSALNLGAARLYESIRSSAITSFVVAQRQRS